MDLFDIALEEIALEGLEGVALDGLWKCLEKRQPPIQCAIDKWTKPFLWKQLASSEYVYFVYVDFEGPRKNDIPPNKVYNKRKVSRFWILSKDSVQSTSVLYHGVPLQGERIQKLPQFWIYDHRDGTTGYSTTFFYRQDITGAIRNNEFETQFTLQEAVHKWSNGIRVVAVQDFRRRQLFGTSNPPIIEEVTPVRSIILEIIAKGRWEGFMQADFQKDYGLDPRTSFHHVKLLLKLHLITKQSILLSQPVNDDSTPIPPKSTKMLHLSKFSNVFTNNLQKAAAKICKVLEEAPDNTIERNELKILCGDIPQFKKVRQWLFHTGYIRYIVNGQIWTSDNMNPAQITHFRACRPCYVSLVRKFQVLDVDDDKDDDFMDYIENCDDIEPRLVYEETLHHQAYRVIIACREKGITMKKLAEVMCIPYTMARSFIRYFDTNSIGRIVTIDQLKLKVQKIVAIQFLHQSETVQQIKSNKQRIDNHKASLKDEKPKVKKEFSADQSIIEQNLELADEVGFTRVSMKSKVSLRHLARKNYVLDSLKEQPVWEGSNELYKTLVFQEDARRSTQGLCCRKTFKRILESLEKDGQIKKYAVVLDKNIAPPFVVSFFCAAHITESSQEYLDAVDSARGRYRNQEKRREIKKAIKENPRSKKQKGSASHTSSTAEETPSVKNESILSDKNTENELTDTDDEDFNKSIGLSTSRSMENRYFTFGRFQKLHVLHLYLWNLVYGTAGDLKELAEAGGPNMEFIDLVQSRHIWMKHAHGLPEYKEGPGWFNVGDIISLMPLEVTCRVLGIKCWSNTLIKYLDDPVKRLLRMSDLPPRLKYKMLVSPANKQHLDNAVDLLVYLAQMGLIAVSPTYYPKIRQEIMLFLRKEARITDTRFTEKTYCHIQLPEGMDEFPVNTYTFNNLADVGKYWTDLQFVCLNTPLGLNRIERNKSSATKPPLNKEEQNLGKGGLGRYASTSNNKSRMYRSFTVLRDFQQYYEDKNFTHLQPVVFGNGLGAGGLDSCFFGHLAKNWRYGKKVGRRSRANCDFVNKSAIGIDFTNGKMMKAEEDSTQRVDAPHASKKSGKPSTNPLNDSSSSLGNKIIVTNLMVQSRRGGKGLKRKLASTSAVMTKKMKMERKKYFDKLIAKRFEHVREKVRITEIRRKAMRKNTQTLHAMNHDEKDREALRRMKGMRVSFTEREDAYLLLTEIVKTMMKISDKGQPLEKEHPKVYWHAIRDILHNDVPESRDKTWNAIERRARYIKKYPHSLIVFKTCVAELEQDKEFMASLQCTKDNWKVKVLQAFEATKDIYSRHFNQQVEMKNFPSSLTKLRQEFTIEYAYLEDKQIASVELKSEKDIRISILQDLMHNSLTAQKLTSYIPAVAFKVFDAYPPDELNEAFEHYRQNKLISRYRVDVPRRRSLPVSTMTYSLSTTYFRIFEPSMPLRIFLMAKNLYNLIRDGKSRQSHSKEQEVSQLDDISPLGVFSLDFSHIQGGHVAYLLSAIVNDKLKLNFTLPEEMTINDEVHLKRLKEGNLNFQRVAFEQRIKRGESLVQRKRNLTMQSVRDPKDNICIASKKTITSELSLASPELREGNSRDVTKSSSEYSSCDGDHFISANQLSNKSKSVDMQNQSEIDDQSKPDDSLSYETDNDISVPNQLNIVDLKFNQSETELPDLLQSDSCSEIRDSRPILFNVIKNTSNESTASKKHHSKIADNSAAAASLGRRKCRDGSSETASLSLQSGNLMVFLNSKPKHLTCSYSKSDIKNVYQCGIPPHVRLQRGYDYATFHSFQGGRSKTSKSINTKLVDIFKDGKIHASRTALTMHRSIGDEKLMPTNAMNTHDALVINPMKVTSYLYASPYRQFGGKLKHSAHERDMLKRFSKDTTNDGYVGSSLTVDEYADILKDELQLNEESVRFHRAVIERIKSGFVLGVKEGYLKDIFGDVSEAVLLQWDDHLQTLLNFGMVYRVGHYDVRLVDSMYFSSWCFRAPQMVSDFEQRTEEDNNVSLISTSIQTSTETISVTTAVTDATIGAGTEVETENRHQKNISKSSVPQETASLESVQQVSSDNTDTKGESTSCKNVSADTGFVDCEAENAEHNCTAKDLGKRKISRDGYKITKVRPWLKLDGELNGVLLKRFQETILIYILMHPGVTQELILNHFRIVLKPAMTTAVLEFLEINGCIKKQRTQKANCSLFSKLDAAYNTSMLDGEVYYLPTTTAVLNMMDINR